MYEWLLEQIKLSRKMSPERRGWNTDRGATARAHLGTELPVDTLGALKQPNAQDSSGQNLGSGHGQACTGQPKQMISTLSFEPDNLRERNANQQ